MANVHPRGGWAWAALPHKTSTLRPRQVPVGLFLSYAMRLRNTNKVSSWGRSRIPRAVPVSVFYAALVCVSLRPRKSRMAVAISRACVANAKCPSAFGLSRLKASAFGGRKKGSFLLSRMKFLCVPWGLRPRRTEQKLALSLLSMLPSAHLNRVGVRVVSFRGSPPCEQNLTLA